MGNPVNPSYMPLPFFGFSQEMTFQQRLVNTLGTLALILGS
jgi:hypothetical protein